MSPGERELIEAAKAYVSARERGALSSRHYRRMRKAWSALVRADRIARLEEKEAA